MDSFPTGTDNNAARLRTDEARWQAVTRRDRTADGAFVYAVRTTGVYCRPSCAARLARRDHVAFYATSAEAQRAGFRPCKRCRPDDPRMYKGGGDSGVIHFAVRECWLGLMLVAVTDKGVRSISFGDEERALVRDLQQRFPAVQLIEDGAQLETLIAAVVEFVTTPAASSGVPLDLRGTAFQRRVWQALRDIPVGSTASYFELAQRIGQPRSARAVARACASNPLAVAVPCHRAIRSDGSLSGYRWGVERKRALLEREAARLCQEPVGLSFAHA